MSTSMLFLELPTYCGVEKWSSRHPHKLEIVGSSPTPATRAFRCWQIPYRLGIASTSICEAEKPTHRHSPIELRPRKGAIIVWDLRLKCAGNAEATTEMENPLFVRQKCYIQVNPRSGVTACIYLSSVGTAIVPFMWE